VNIMGLWDTSPVVSRLQPIDCVSNLNCPPLHRLRSIQSPSPAMPRLVNPVPTAAPLVQPPFGLQQQLSRAQVLVRSIQERRPLSPSPCTRPAQDVSAPRKAGIEADATAVTAQNQNQKARQSPSSQSFAAESQVAQDRATVQAPDADSWYVGLI
jgi:hypothetical protein